MIRANGYLRLEGAAQANLCVSESYRGGQLKLLLCSGLARLRSIVTNDESENISAKLSSFFHCPAGHQKKTWDV